MLFLARELDFQEPLDGTGDLKLEHGPFDQGLCDVTKFSSLPFGNAFEFSAEILADTHAYLSLPFAHTEEHAENWAGKGKINKNGRNNDHQKSCSISGGEMFHFPRPAASPTFADHFSANERGIFSRVSESPDKQAPTFRNGSRSLHNRVRILANALKFLDKIFQLTQFFCVVLAQVSVNPRVSHQRLRISTTDSEIQFVDAQILRRLARET